MINFVFGTERSEKTEYILEKMRFELARDRHVLCISPETEALAFDRTVSENLTPSEGFRVETLSFSRTADSIFRKYGGGAKNYITDTKKSVLIWRALKSVSPLLTVFGGGKEEKYIFAIKDAIREAKAYNATPLILSELSEQLYTAGKNEGLANRLHDLSLIWAAYEALLNKSYSDPEESLDRLAEKISESSPFESTAVFIDGFHSFTPKERAVIREIFKSSPEVYISFATTADDREKIHTEHIRREKKELARLANDCGCEIRITEIESTGKKAELRYLSEKLWDYSTPPYSEASEAVKIYTVGDRFDEAAVCSSLICETVRGGARFSDILVICSDYEKYRGILDTSFEIYNIPAYISAKTELQSEAIMRFIISAINICAFGYRREDVLSFAKTRLTSISPEECDALEKYTNKWRLRGKNAFVCEGWNMNPSGYTESLSEWDKQLLMLANSAREKLIPAIHSFSLSLNKTVEDACRGLYKLLLEFSVYEKIKDEAAALYARGEGAAAQEKEQLYAVIIEILDSLVEAAGDEIITPLEFSRLFTNAAKDADIATIPDYIDRVTVKSGASIGSASALHTIILGAAQGEFPLTPCDNGFFSESDKEALSPLGLSLSPGMELKRSEELFRFYLAVSDAKQSLSVIIPTSGDGISGELSSGAKRILRLLPNTAVFKNKHKDKLFLMQNKGSLKYQLSERDSAEIKAAGTELIEKNILSKALSSAETDAVSSEFAGEIFGDEMFLSQSRLESFNSCPQSYYLKYILSLDDGEEIKINPSDIGNFVHKILEEFLSLVKEEGLSFPLDEKFSYETAKILIENYISRVCPENFGGRLKYIFSRISKSIMLYIRSLSNEFSVSSFKPFAFELAIGKKGGLPALEIALSDESTMAIVGIVDRLDSYSDGENVYVKVVDYKTGNKKFSLSDVMQGKNIQLLLYLFSICAMGDCEFRKRLAPNNEKLLPAGAVYFSAVAGDLSSSTPISDNAAEELVFNSISRTGIVLDDEKIISAMEPNAEGKFIPVKYKKDGTMTKSSSVATKDEFDEIKNGLCSVLGEIGEKMRSGCAFATPKSGHDSPCEYCKMAPVCRVAK